MRLEYTEEQERQLRITELEAVLDNGLYENEEDKQSLELELQSLQKNTDKKENIMNEWYKTDDLQWCKSLGNRRYKFIQAICLGSMWSDICPANAKDNYNVCSGLIDLNDYSEEEIESVISSYYDSYSDMLRSYGVSKENARDLDSIVAECIFEEECLIEDHSHGMFEKDKAVQYVETWIKEQ